MGYLKTLGYPYILGCPGHLVLQCRKARTYLGVNPILKNWAISKNSGGILSWGGAKKSQVAEKQHSADKLYFKTLTPLINVGAKKGTPTLNTGLDHLWLSSRNVPH